jgi:hypothetical protein
MTLGRPFKAGAAVNKQDCVAWRRLNPVATRRNETFVGVVFQALKGRAKFTSPLRGVSHRLSFNAISSSGNYSLLIRDLSATRDSFMNNAGQKLAKQAAHHPYGV